MSKRILGSALLAGMVLPWMTAILGAQEQPGPTPPATAPAPWTAQPEELYRRPGELAVRLANGMVTVIRENKVAPVAEIRMYVRTGSIYEQEYLGAGLSHLFEHLLVGGQTKTRTEADSLNLLQQIGARWNAYTTNDHTCYYMTVPARHIGTALSLIADWVTRPAFPQEAFEREWGVVQRELEMYHSNPDFQLSCLLAELRYRVHPARYPVIGYQPILQTLTRRDVLAYYQRMYVPDRTVLCIVGDINAEGMLQAVQKEFADFSRRPVAAIVLPDEPAVLAPREMVKVMPSMQGPVKMVLGFPSIKLEDAELYPLDTLAAILGSGRNSRLYQALHEKEQLVLSVSAFSDTPAWAEGTFAIVCELAGEQVAPAQAAIRRELERIQAEPVQPEELARVKKRLQVDHVRANQTAEQQAASLGQDYLATGDPHFSDAYVEGIQRVTAEQVRLAAQKYLRADRQLRLIVTSRPLPAADAKAAEPTVAGPIRKITLDNGLRVLIKRNPSVPLVDVRLYVLGGLMQETDENNGISNLMAQLSTKGTRQYTAQQIIDYFESVGGRLNAGAGNNTVYYTAEVMPADLPRALEIFSEVVLAPTFPADELAKLKSQVIAEIQQVDNSWPRQAQRLFRSVFYQKSPYRRSSLGSEAAVQSMTGGQLTAFHQSAVVGARTVLAVFGDVEPAAVENLVRRQFESFPKGQPLAVETLALDAAAAEERQVVESSAKTGSYVYVGFPGLKLTSIGQRYPLEVLTEIIGSYTSANWLFDTLRGAQLVYAAGGTNFMGVLPGYFAATAQCEPDKAAEALKIMRSLLAKAARGEITPEEVARAKSSLINREAMAYQTNADQGSAAALDELLGMGYDWWRGNTERIMAVDHAQVLALAKQILSAPPTVVILTSQPERLSTTKAEPN